LIASLNRQGRQNLISNCDFDTLADLVKKLTRSEFLNLIQTRIAPATENLWRDLFDIFDTCKSPGELAQKLQLISRIEAIHPDAIKGLLVLYRHRPSYLSAILHHCIQSDSDSGNNHSPITIRAGEHTCSVNRTALEKKASYFRALPQFSEQKNTLDLTDISIQLKISPTRMIQVMRVLSGDRTVPLDRATITAMLRVRTYFQFNAPLSAFLDHYLDMHAESLPFDLKMDLVHETPHSDFADNMIMQLLQGDFSHHPSAERYFKRLIQDQNMRKKLIEIATVNSDFYLKNNLKLIYLLGSDSPLFKSIINRFIRENSSVARQAWPLDERPREVSQILYRIA
jgi:hypothetical protein